MKFLCDQCKAKYQIADEKVAGKTVRMKCRKCGHQIEVRAAVTGTSVSTAPPRPDGTAAPDARAPRGLATSLSAARPTAPRPAAAKADAGGALASAFQRTVQESSPPSRRAGAEGEPIGADVSVTDEWYVAINGVPVGPVRISELRRKAAAGVVTEDSLVWQEGLEEWRPVRTLTELSAIVREAALAGRVSLVAPPPPEARAGHAPTGPRGPATRPMGREAMARPESPRPAPVSSVSPFSPAPAAARSNVVPFHARGATAERLDEAQLEPFVQAPLAPPPPSVAADPFAVPGGPALAPDRSSQAYFPPQPQLQLQARRGPPWWFIAVLVLAASFGITLAVVFFKQPPPAPVVIQMPAAPTAQPLAPATPTITDTTMPSAAASGSAKPVAVAMNSGAQKPAGAAAPSATSRTADLSGLLGGAGGPSAGGTAGGTAGSGGGLTAAAVQLVVRDRQVGVKRTCWERQNDTKSSVNVTITAVVGPSGAVQNTSSSGDDPAVGKCIEGQVRGWTFPAPGATTTINIPFHFVRQ